MGDAVVQGVGGPAGEIIRQRVALAPLLEVIAAAILAAGQVAADAVGQVGGCISGLAPQGDGPACEVAQEIRQRHGAVDGAVAVGGGVVEQDIIGHHGVVVAKAPEPHPDAHRVTLAPDAALDPDGNGAVVVDLGAQVLQVHPGLPAGKAAAARGSRCKGGVAGAPGGVVLHGVGHLFGQDVLAPAVHQSRHDEGQVHLPAKAGVVGREAVFRQIEPPVQRPALVFFPGQGADGGGQQPHGRGGFVVVGREVDLQLDAGAAARRGHGDGVPQQEDHPVLALGVGAAAGVIRGPLAKAHPAGPGVPGIDPAAHLHHRVMRGAGVPADVQVAESRHRELRRGVAAVGQIPPGGAVQHQSAAFQRDIVQRAAGESLGALQHEVISLFHRTILLCASVKDQCSVPSGSSSPYSSRRAASSSASCSFWRLSSMWKTRFTSP
jgi:hypothetical protein